jgi:hypothetical protein
VGKKKEVGIGMKELLIPPKSKYQIRDQFRSLEKSDDGAITAILISA